MDINIFQLSEGAKQATGTTVIIDVFRAFTTACFAISKGVEQIIPVGDINIAYKLKQEHPDYLLVGEREEQKPEGFDFGNSPTHINNAFIRNKTMVHTTSSGTQGIVNAIHAEEILSGSFVNVQAIVNYIRRKNPKKVSLVCMGYNCTYPTTEDTLCAEYIKNELEGKENNFEAMVERIKRSDGQRFFDPEKQAWSPESDFYLCVDINRFDFVLRLEKTDELNYLRPCEI
jgi:2-phosphosulfolactate phosphatase